MNNMTYVKQTEVMSNNRTFVIVKDSNNQYLGIENTEINTDGTLKRQLNGITGMLSDTVNECITKCLQRIAIDALIQSGVNPITASAMVICGLNQNEVERMV